MTEKRFTKQEVYDGINRYQINESNFIVEILDDGIPMHYSTIVNRLNEQHKTITRLENKNEQLKSENKRLTDKLNKTALELVDGVISQGKATEISEMSYREFLDYRAKNGKPMELQE